MKKLTIEVSETVYELLCALDDQADVKYVVGRLIDHAQQGVYRPGAWERQWLCQIFGDEWTDRMEPGDPYGRPDSPMFQRPKKERG